VAKARYWICRTDILRPISASKKTKGLCQPCFKQLVADEKKSGSQVVEGERVEMVYAVKRSPYRTDQ
jgi:hypothetical protein